MDEETVQLPSQTLPEQPEMDPGMRDMITRNNRQFTGKEAWKTRKPLCLDCKKEMPVVTRSKPITVEMFDRGAWELCTDTDCKNEDHILANAIVPTS